MKYIEEILCFLVMGALVLQLAPDESFRKIMRFFIGLMLLIFVLNAISVFLKMDGIETSDFEIWEASPINYQSVFDRYYEEEVPDEENK